MNEQMVKALNNQINYEFYSSYLYLSMASYLKSMNLNGFSHWMEIQVQEELVHAQKLYNYLHDRGGSVELQEISKPQKEWGSIREVFEDAYKHEQSVTSRINDLVDMALSQRDHATNAQLQWFISEQVEEEANTLEILQQVRLAEGSPNGLFMLDRELGQRTYTLPTADNSKGA